jgi:thiamine pyrophosphokinase
MMIPIHMLQCEVIYESNTVTHTTQSEKTKTDLELQLYTI